MRESDEHRRAFPQIVAGAGYTFVRSATPQEDIESGIDVWAKDSLDHDIPIQIKARSSDYPDILIELRHEYINLDPNRPHGSIGRGRVYRPTEALVLLYVFIPSQTGWAIDMPALHSLFETQGGEIEAQYKLCGSHKGNHGYETISTPVPPSALVKLGVSVKYFTY